MGVSPHHKMSLILKNMIDAKTSIIITLEKPTDAKTLIIITLERPTDAKTSIIFTSKQREYFVYHPMRDFTS